MIVFFLSVFVSAQTVIGHGVTSRCKWNNMILQRRVASLFHRNKELMCMVEKVKPKGSLSGRKLLSNLAAAKTPI